MTMSCLSLFSGFTEQLSSSSHEPYSSLPLTNRPQPAHGNRPRTSSRHGMLHPYSILRVADLVGRPGQKLTKYVQSRCPPVIFFYHPIVDRRQALRSSRCCNSRIHYSSAQTRARPLLQKACSLGREIRRRIRPQIDGDD